MFSARFCLVLMVSLLLGPGSLSLFSSSEMKAAEVRQLEIMSGSDLNYGEIIQIRASVSVSGVKGQSVSVKTKIGRKNGNPLYVASQLPSGWEQDSGSIQHAWTGIIQNDRSSWTHLVTLPIRILNLSPERLEHFNVRCQIRVGSLKSYQIAEMDYPFQAANPVRAVQINQVSSERAVQKYSQPNVAGMEVDEPNISIENHIEQFQFSMSANGLKGETIFGGVVFRNLNGQGIGPGNRCPTHNRGKNGQAQFEANDAINYDQAGWKNFLVKVPLDWLALDTADNQTLIATFYISAGGLWNVLEREVVLQGTSNGGIKGLSLRNSNSDQGRFRSEDEMGRVNPDWVNPDRGNPTEALFRAVSEGDESGVEYCLKSGADVRGRNSKGEIPLHVAVRNGNTEIAKLLIEEDEKRAEQENDGTFTMSFNEFLKQRTPTLFMADNNGMTPVHSQALSGNPAMAKLLKDHGSSAAESAEAGSGVGQSTPVGQELRLNKPVTRYAVPLKQILSQLEGVLRSLQQQTGGTVSPQTIQPLGRELYAIGEHYLGFFAKDPASITRFGTLEEADLIERIRATHEKAAVIFKSLSGVRLVEENQTSNSSRRDPSMLEETARSIIEQQAIRYLQRKGLGDLLADSGLTILGKKVGKQLKLDLKGFMDRKSMEVVRMPMGGFKSMKAAFRLQARRKVRETVANITLEFTGNRLVVYFLQNTVLRWVEGELWPQLREAFRPKTKLDRRVNISANTMLAMRDKLNVLGGTGQAQMVPLLEVQAALDKASGTIEAARYLKKDLERAGNQELIDTLAAAENILNRSVYMISYQFLLIDKDRFEDIVDNIDYSLGIHEEVGKLLGGILVSSCDMNLTIPKQEELIKGIHSKGTCSLPIFDLKLSGISPGLPGGIKHLSVQINDRKYVLLSKYNGGGDTLRFRGCLPLFPGQNKVVISSQDIPGVPVKTFDFSYPTPQKQYYQDSLEKTAQWLPGMEQDMLRASDYYRPLRTLEIGQKLVDISKYLCLLGNFPAAGKTISKAMEYINQAGMGARAAKGIGEAYARQAWIALSVRNVSDYQRFKKAELDYQLQYLQYLKSKNVFRSVELCDVYKAGFEMSDMLLVHGVSADMVRSYVDTSMKLLMERNPGKGVSAFDNNFKNDYPNVAAVFFEK